MLSTLPSGTQSNATSQEQVGIQTDSYRRPDLRRTARGCVESLCVQRCKLEIYSVLLSIKDFYSVFNMYNILQEKVKCKYLLSNNTLACTSKD